MKLRLTNTGGAKQSSKTTLTYKLKIFIFTLAVTPTTARPATQPTDQSANAKVPAAARCQLPMNQEDDPEIAIWAKTKMSEAYAANSYFTNARCENLNADKVSERMFISCVAGINFVAQNLMKRPALLTTPTVASVAAHKLSEKPIESFGSLQLYRDRSVEVTPGAKFDNPIATFRLRQHDQWVAMQLLYRQIVARQAAPIDFSAIVRRIGRQAVAENGKQKEAYLYGMMVNGAMMVANDPHSYLDPLVSVQANQQSVDQRYVGIGAELAMSPKDCSTIVADITPGSPAEKSGLHSGDILLSVNRLNYQTSSFASLLKEIRGKAGEPVSLTVSRKNQIFSVKIVRKELTDANFQVQVLDLPIVDLAYDASKKAIKEKVGYILYKQFFDDRSCDLLEKHSSYFGKALYDLEHVDHVSAIILDLRGNGGGDMDLSTCIASLFVGKRAITIERFLNGRPDEVNYGYNSAMTNLPMLTLIDGGSASASETVASALRDYKRSWLAGQRTFGKGTMQQGDPAGAGVLRDFVWFHTVARIFQPSGTSSRGVGITPDFEIPPVPNATESDLDTEYESDSPNALPPIGPRFIQSKERAAATAAIQVCINGNRAPIDARFKKLENKAALSREDLDYQRQIATVAMSCIVHYERSHPRVSQYYDFDR